MLVVKQLPNYWAIKQPVLTCLQWLYLYDERQDMTFQLHLPLQQFLQQPFPSIRSADVVSIMCLTFWRVLSGIFGKKRCLNTRGFAREYLRSCSGYRPGRSVKRRGMSSSLHLKKNFLLGGCWFFVSDVISGGLLGQLDPLCLALSANR